MTPPLRIAIRFLLAHKRAMAMSLAGITFGIGFFIITQAQTGGFENFYIETVLGTDGAIKVEDKFQAFRREMDAGGEVFDVTTRENRRYVEGTEEPERVREAIFAQFPNVTAISAVVRGTGNFRSTLRDVNGEILGIELENQLAVSRLGQQVTFGDLDAFRQNPSGMIIGRVLAGRLQAKIGESILVTVGDQIRRFTISAFFETGVTEIDKGRAFVHIGAARSLMKRPHGASFLQISVLDRELAEPDAAQMQEVVRHRVIGWKEREKVWLDVFAALRISSALAVSTIILISALGMFNTLTMIVMEKTREIAILRSMGYTRHDIGRIFLWQGAMILTVGTILGSAFAVVSTYTLEHVPIRIRGIFSTDNFVVEWSVWHYVAAAVTAGIVVMFACTFPARRAARLEPGSIIRGTS